jgi:hypothetical protein
MGGATVPLNRAATVSRVAYGYRVKAVVVFFVYK